MADHMVLFRNVAGSRVFTHAASLTKCPASGCERLFLKWQVIENSAGVICGAGIRRAEEPSALTLPRNRE